MAQGVKRDDALKRRAEFSSQLSTQCRTLTAGLLAFGWALMTGEHSPLRDPHNQVVSSIRIWNLIGISVVAMLVLCFGALQYYAGMRVQERCLKKMTEDDSAMYDHDFMYTLQNAAFITKLVALMLGLLWLLGLLAFLLIN